MWTSFKAHWQPASSYRTMLAFAWIICGVWKALITSRLWIFSELAEMTQPLSFNQKTGLLSSTLWEISPRRERRAWQQPVSVIHTEKGPEDPFFHPWNIWIPAPGRPGLLGQADHSVVRQQVPSLHAEKDAQEEGEPRRVESGHPQRWCGYG